MLSSIDGIIYQCLSYADNDIYVVVAMMTVTNQIKVVDDITVMCFADNMVPPSQSETIVIDITGKQLS